MIKHDNFYAFYYIYVNETIPDLRLELDLSDVKLNYFVGDIFNLDEIKIKAISSYEEKDININECVVSLYLNDQYKKSLDEAGTYRVRILYKNVTAEYYIAVVDSLIETLEISPRIMVVSNSQTSISIDNLLNKVTGLNIGIYFEDELVYNLKNLNEEIYFLEENKLYTLKGYYTGIIDGEEYKVNVITTTFIIE